MARNGVNRGTADRVAQATAGGRIEGWWACQDRAMGSPAVVCDLDGVVWLADTVIPGSPEAVARLRAAGRRVVFVTNNSFSSVAVVEEKLGRMGIPARGDVVTSAMAAARLVRAGERVLLCGGPGAEEELLRQGATVVRRTDEPVDVVVVGFHRDADYEEIRQASTAVRRGARLIGTNDDATYPTPDGPIPGCGAILAAVATAAGVTPVVAGKPYPAMVDLLRSIVSEGDVLAVGDRLDTDGRLARAMGARFGLVLTGVTSGSTPLDPRPDRVAADLAALVDAELS
jgi:4-nitrophenyl phosphatase